MFTYGWSEYPELELVIIPELAAMTFLTFNIAESKLVTSKDNDPFTCIFDWVLELEYPLPDEISLLFIEISDIASDLNMSGEDTVMTESISESFDELEHPTITRDINTIMK